jgi:hypothetical protein
MSFDAMDLEAVFADSSTLAILWHSSSFGLISTKGNQLSMSKTIDAITENIRNPKPPFRKADDKPAKAQKHRYERRKIKEYIKLGDWAPEGTA